MVVKRAYLHRISIFLIQLLESIVECVDLITYNLQLLILGQCLVHSYLILFDLYDSL